MSKCILCQSNNFKSIYNLNGKTSLKKCQKCGLIKTVGSTKASYDHYHRDTDYTKLRELYKNIFRLRYNLIIKYKKTGKVLEIGSSTGALLEIFKNNGWEVLGIEPSASAKTANKLGIKTIQKTLQNAKINNKFDVIILNHTLEHVDNPIKVLKKAKRLLKTDGIIYIDVPNFDSLDRKVKGKKWKYILPNEHTYHFTPISLEKILKNNFQILEIKTKSGIFDQKNFFKKIYLTIKLNKPYLYKNLALDILNIIPNLITTKVLNQGVSLHAIAKNK